MAITARPLGYAKEFAFDKGSAVICDGKLVGIDSLYYNRSNYLLPEVYFSVRFFWQFLLSSVEGKELQATHVYVDSKCFFLLLILSENMRILF